MRPGALTDDPGSGRARIQTEPIRDQVARDDVAAVLAAVLHEPRSARLTIYVVARRRADRRGARARSSDARRAHDRGPGGRDLGRLAGARRRLRAARHRDACSGPTTTCPSSAAASAARSTPGRRSTRSRAITPTLRLGTLVSPATFRHPSELAKVVVTRRPRVGRARRARPRHGLARGRARGLRLPLPAARRAHADARSEQLQLISAASGPTAAPAQPKPRAAAAAEPDRGRPRRAAQHPLAARYARRVQHRQQDRRRVRRHPRAAGRGLRRGRAATRSRCR